MALRIYDALGLLRPALTDVDSGFRYNSVEQVHRARRIKELRAAEMPLRTIQALLQVTNAGHARTLLTQHRQWVAERIAAHERGLDTITWIEHQYERIEREQHMEPMSTNDQCSFSAAQHLYELLRLIVLFGRSPAERARQTGAAERTLYRPAAGCQLRLLPDSDREAAAGVHGLV